MLAVRVNVRNQQTFNKLNNYLLNLSPEVSKGVQEWGNILVKDLRNSAMRAGITNFSGALLKGRGIRWEMRPKGYVGYLYMYQYGTYLDRMRNHYVTVKRTRKNLREWYSQKVSALGPNEEPTIFVRKHPFINEGFRIARPKLNRIAMQKARYRR